VLYKSHDKGHDDNVVKYLGGSRKPTCPMYDPMCTHCELSHTHQSRVYLLNIILFYVNKQIIVIYVSKIVLRNV